MSGVDLKPVAAAVASATRALSVMTAMSKAHSAPEELSEYLDTLPAATRVAIKRAAQRIIDVVEVGDDRKATSE